MPLERIQKREQLSDFELESKLKTIVDKEVTAKTEDMSEMLTRQEKFLIKQWNNIKVGAQQNLIAAHLKSIEDARDKT